MGDKISARNLMADAGVPVAAGTREPVDDVDAAVAAARDIGYPLMVKASAGGGGIGMGVAHDDDGLRAAFETARTRAERFFGSPAILLERYIEGARHVEIQVLGLADGRVVALGERDCSVQRRHQKVAEETPSPGVTEALRRRDARRRGARRRGGRLSQCRHGRVPRRPGDARSYVFLEMNTRLQVEHPITELVTGIDLVEEQLRIAAGDRPRADLDATSAATGTRLELRVYAEDPVRFLPSPGDDHARGRSRPASSIRVDAGYAAGDDGHAVLRPAAREAVRLGRRPRRGALDRAREAVAQFRIEGRRRTCRSSAELLDDATIRLGRLRHRAHRRDAEHD